MDFEILKKEFGDIFSPGFKEIFNRGIEEISRFKDDLNGLGHTIKLLDYLSQIKKNSIIELSNTEYESLILASVWHDLWKASHANDTLLILSGLFVEGFFAARTFELEAHKLDYDKGLTNKVSYVIKKHSEFSFVRETRESRVFHDVDQLAGRESISLKLKNKKIIIKTVYLIQKILPQFYYYSEIRGLKEQK